ncbi:MAG: alanine--tRNA ligase [Phycisphaerales bacterium]|nr:alanine--tRNA ligase [Phycisphaerales bacterium]
MDRPPTAFEVRQGFIDFFETKAAHRFISSSPVIPMDDPTLLFTNAGMNQFKDVFLGQGTRDTTRAVNSQKCIRAGGKHNDLEDVGADTYHHTFFEMLGNWSFGDYFKAEAIEWAWQLLTDVWGLDKSRIYVTVFEGDEADGTKPDLEAEQLWKERTDIDPTHITRWGRKDNFWEMGATGPCGPCSEIHYDCTPDGTGAELVNLDHPDVIEVWNLVFIEFNRRDDGALVPLPAQHVDTGMGLERIVRVLQNKRSNYDTDLWTPLFEAIQQATGVRPYGADLTDPIDVAYRVIADHVRCLTVAISDGGRPGNEGRGYVLRRILRRGVRMARQVLGVEGPMLCTLVPAVVQSLQGAFPELNQQADTVANIIRDEEEAFLRTLDRGLQRFDVAAQKAHDTGATIIEGEVAFQLHDTYGFPIDLTEVMATERGLTVDRAAYEARMEQARAQSRGGTASVGGMTLPPEALASLQAIDVHASDDEIKYGQRVAAGRIKAIWNGEALIDHAPATADVGVIFDRTNFYAEQGGQIADSGTAVLESDGTIFAINDVRRFGDWVLHIGAGRSGSITVGDEVMLRLDSERRDHIESNHTATHLLNHALRTVLGNDVEQRGSLVADDKLRFDFTHGQPCTPDELVAIELHVNKAINDGLVVDAAEVDLDTAMSINGVRAVFGERYPDPVRVVSIGATVAELLANPANDAWERNSIEFCGGTHLQQTTDAGEFILLSEQGLAAGIRRIVAITGSEAGTIREQGELLLKKVDTLAAMDGADLATAHAELVSSLESSTLGIVHRHAVASGLEAEKARARDARKATASIGIEAVLEQARTIEVDGDIAVGTLTGATRDGLMAALDLVRGRHDTAGCMLIAHLSDSGKVAIVARVPETLIARGLKAGDWVREAAQACGGSGGGKPDMAQAGGKDPDRIDDAQHRAQHYAREVLA